MSCCLGLWALSLSLTLAMVNFSGGVAWLIGFWVVLGTNQFGRSEEIGKSKTLDSGVVVGSWIFLPLLVRLCLVAWVVCFSHQVLLGGVVFLSLL